VKVVVQLVAQARVKRPLVQILVVVANIQMRTLNGCLVLDLSVDLVLRELHGRQRQVGSLCLINYLRVTLPYQTQDNARQ
jgi:hypothetical protein